MHDASGLSYFMEYMDRQHLMTLVQFWIVVDGFRNPLEDEMLMEDDVSGGQPQWTDADRSDLVQIYEAYLKRREMKISEGARAAIRDFVDAGRSASTLQYRQARGAVMKVQAAVLEDLQENHFPRFKQSDLYYKHLASEETSVQSVPKPPARSLKPPTFDSIPESPTRRRAIPRASSTKATSRTDLVRNAASNSDLKSASNFAETSRQGRRSLDINPSAPLFDDDADSDFLANSTQTLRARVTEWRLRRWQSREYGRGNGSGVERYHDGRSS